VDLSLFKNCPPLFSVLQLTSPVLHAHVLWILLKPPQLRFPYTPGAYWFQTSKLSARIQYLHSKEVFQPNQSSYFHHINHVHFIVERIKLIMVSRYSYHKQDLLPALSATKIWTSSKKPECGCSHTEWPGLNYRLKAWKTNYNKKENPAIINAANNAFVPVASAKSCINKVYLLRG